MPIETSSLTLGEISLSGKGAKSVSIMPATMWSPGELRVLWQPSGFNDPSANRVAISFTSTPEVEVDILQLENWVLETLAANPQKYFGQELSLVQLKGRFTSAIKTSEKGYRSLRAKMNFTGKGAVQCWTAEKAKRELPEDWTACSVKPRLQIKSIWLMSREFGLLLEMSDALLEVVSVACPF